MMSKILKPETAAEPKGYKGFLYIKCRKCGEVHAFCTRERINGSICPCCGARTFFTEPLKVMRIYCECGLYTRYMTNLKEEMFDANCINCGSLVAVKYNSRKNRYETIRE
ncbi:hypothetical protein CE91St54_42000 [Hungatella hathewayi]|uniref:DNA-directed RNA polymerase subunit P n=2 Tax=Hungatella TaxID=1649459 RepID=A0AA37N4S3_9FIRM|nr:MULTISPECIES: hypothetical protein [Hungatella]MBC5710977.1 hypothetical protein [Hungatella hominis]RGZ07355.1 hypothetical protein DXA14_01350 [Hungatella hathewayi]GKH02828.1 hypothetical protein CE91St55_48090 [Hungatella hathewayi]GKH09092.1 hypothetical protein CE91St54_42000 [Hungatella hathewayi]